LHRRPRRAAAGHPSRLRERHLAVITNLLENAIKYGQGRPVEVRLDDGPDEVALSVVDHGIGIRAQDLSRIFERFERAVSERNYSGLGLGLYIARTVVEALGGRIWAESRPGEETRFTVWLPRGRATPDPGGPPTLGSSPHDGDRTG
jgi:signal transduction histidine kinase